MNEQITGALFKRMVLHGAAVITAQKQAINDLNVFPVPDGDTGTNMSMTIGTAVTELRKTPARHCGRRRPPSPPPPCCGGPAATPASSSPCCSEACPRP